MKLTPEELNLRRDAFCADMDAALPDWTSAVFVTKANQYYFTGSMQNALLIITREREVNFFVRESYERAREESPLEGVHKMRSYRDAAAIVGESLGNAYVESEAIPLAYVERLQKSFKIAKIGSLDSVIKYRRAVKSPYELYCMGESGQRARKIQLEAVPEMLHTGMLELEFHGQVFLHMLRQEHPAIARFNAFQTELLMGQCAFGDSTLTPIDFDGPSGGLGAGAFAPSCASPYRQLKEGDLVIADFSLNWHGYHSDCTQIYCFRGTPEPLALSLHRECMDIEQKIAERLRPGEVPSKIYADIMESLSPELAKRFMGSAKKRARFIAHGIGLTVDEFPVIATGFDRPLEEGMTLAVEPKAGIEGLGIVGVEDTYVVTPDGGRCLTGGGREIMLV